MITFSIAKLDKEPTQINLISQQQQQRSNTHCANAKDTEQIQWTLPLTPTRTTSSSFNSRHNQLCSIASQRKYASRPRKWRSSQEPNRSREEGLWQGAEDINLSKRNLAREFYRCSRMAITKLQQGTMAGRCVGVEHLLSREWLEFYDIKNMFKIVDNRTTSPCTESAQLVQ